MKKNELAAKYYQLTQAISQMEKEREALKEMLHSEGSFSTREYMVEIEERARESLAGIKQVAEVVGEDTLRNADLIKIITYKTIRVMLKNKAAA